MLITWIEAAAMAGFLVGAIVGELVDQRDTGKAARDDEWADDFISVLHGTSPELYGELSVELRLDAEDFVAKLADVKAMA